MASTMCRNDLSMRLSWDDLSGAIPLIPSRKRLATIMMRAVLYAVAVLIVCADARAAGPGDFAYIAPLTGTGYDVPVCVALPQEIIARSRSVLGDLRLFDDAGTEVAYALSVQTGAVEELVSWDLVESTQSKGRQSFILKRGRQGSRARSVELLAENGPFRKEVEIFSSDDGDSWEYRARGIIVDLRPLVNVFDTTLEIPAGTAASYLMVKMKDARTGGEDPCLGMFFRQLGIDRFQINVEPVALRGAFSRSDTPDRVVAVYDQALFTEPETYLDEEGNTIIDLQTVSLPVDEVAFSIADPYFFRHVELWVSPVSDPEACLLAGRGTICRIQAYDTEKTAIFFGQDTCSRVMIKVVNKNRTPLSIGQIALRWARRELCFIPEQGRSYTLYFGSAGVKAPGYTPGNRARIHPLEGDDYGVWHAGKVRDNEAYAPGGLMAKRFKTLFLIGFSLLVVYVLGCWIIRVRGRIPGSGPG